MKSGPEWLPSELQQALAGESERVEFPEGARLFREGDEADAFYVIEEGVVRIQRWRRHSTVISDAKPRGSCGPRISKKPEAPRRRTRKMGRWMN